MSEQARGPHIPAQWRLVTNPATRAVAGELMAANSMRSAGRGERNLHYLVLRSKSDPGSPDGDLDSKDGHYDPDQP